ncbi:hypothetical protein HK104_007629 [Borealophlyctis nickersoniae]|nr:hypothetical protein HK104_007629 [Borealophlyctis nickersoniae]
MSTETSSTQNPLATETLLTTLSHVIPNTSTLRSGADLTMAYFHAVMVKLGFRFVGLGEEALRSEDKGKGSASSEGDGAAPECLPEGWNASGDAWSFRYRHAQSQLTFLMKGVKIAGKLVVHGMAIEDGTLHTLELSIPSIVSPDFSFPVSALLDVDRLRTAFVSEERLREVVYNFKVKIVQALIPGLHKEGYEEARRISDVSVNS